MLFGSGTGLGSAACCDSTINIDFHGLAFLLLCCYAHALDAGLHSQFEKFPNLTVGSALLLLLLLLRHGLVTE